MTSSARSLPWRSTRWCAGWLVSLTVLVGGCVDGPFGGFGPINPWIQKNWKHDEQFGPTFHRRLGDLRALREEASGLEGTKREELVQDISRQLRTEPNPVLRSEMALVLGELATTSAGESLAGALEDADKDVRIATCRALSKLGGPGAVPELVELLDSEPDIDVRMAIVRELGKFQNPAVVEALGRTLDDDNPAIQHLAVQSLKSATGRDFGDSVPAWRDFVAGREPNRPEEPSMVKRLKNLF